MNKVVKKKNEKSFWKTNYLPALVLFFCAIVLYISTLRFDYVLDDIIVITDNDFTKKGFAGIKDIFTTESFQGYFGEQRDLVEGGRYRPLSIASFAVEYQFFGLNQAVSHFVNVLLYALLALLLFRVMALLFPIKKKKKWYYTLAFVSSLLFVLHPLHTEVVANIKGRDEILSLMGALAALYSIIKYSKKEKRIYLLMGASCYFLALLAKENALTFLAIIPLSLYFFTKTKFKKIAISFVPLFGVALLYLLIRYRVIGYFLSSGSEITDLMNNPFYGISTGERLATAFYTLALYLKLLIFPHPLTHDYYPFQIPILNWQSVPAIISLLIYLALGFVALMGLRKRSVISYGILFYLLTLSIVSNIPFTVGTFMNERFLFMPSIGFCIVLGYFITRELPAFTKEKAGELNLLSAGVLILFATGFITKTLLRVPDWKNRMTLNTSAVKYSPNSARANCFMATALYELDYLKETDQARKKLLLADIDYYISRALQIYPRYSSAITVKAGVLAEQHKLDHDLDKLLNGFYKVLYLKKSMSFVDEYLNYISSRISSTDIPTLVSFYLKTAKMLDSRFRDKTEALKWINAALKIDPNNQNLQNELARLSS